MEGRYAVRVAANVLSLSTPLGLLLAKYGNPENIDPQTYGDAYHVLTTYGEGLFGAAAASPAPSPAPTP